MRYYKLIPPCGTVCHIRFRKISWGLRVKKLHQVLADLSAKLLAIQSSIRQWPITLIAHLDQKTTLIWQGGLSKAGYPSRRSSGIVCQVWTTAMADHSGPTIHCDNTSTYWTYLVNTCSGQKSGLMIVDMQQLSIIEILLTVSGT